MKRNNMNTLLIALGVFALVSIFGRGSNSDIITKLIALPIVIFAITVHEFGHAFMAKQLGDKSQKKRLTLNPFKHIEPLGVLTLLLFNIGWGKPVSVRRENLNKKFKPEVAESLIALGGPLFNILTAAILLILSLKIESLKNLLDGIYTLVIIYNLLLAVFNLIPLPIFDGYTIIKPLLPRGIKNFVSQNYENFMIGAIIFIMFLPPSIITKMTEMLYNQLVIILAGIFN